MDYKRDTVKATKEAISDDWSRVYREVRDFSEIEKILTQSLDSDVIESLESLPKDGLNRQVNWGPFIVHESFGLNIAKIRCGSIYNRIASKAQPLCVNEFMYKLEITHPLLESVSVATPRNEGNEIEPPTLIFEGLYAFSQNRSNYSDIKPKVFMDPACASTTTHRGLDENGFKHYDNGTCAMLNIQEAIDEFQLASFDVFRGLIETWDCSHLSINGFLNPNTAYPNLDFASTPNSSLTAKQEVIEDKGQHNDWIWGEYDVVPTVRTTASQDKTEMKAPKKGPPHTHYYFVWTEMYEADLYNKSIELACHLIHLIWYATPDPEKDKKRNELASAFYDAVSVRQKMKQTFFELLISDLTMQLQWLRPEIDIEPLTDELASIEGWIGDSVGDASPESTLRVARKHGF